MRRPFALAALATALIAAGAAHAQYQDDQPDGYYDDGGYGAPQNQPQAPYQGGQPGMPAYDDDGGYGASDGYGSRDARTASDAAAAQSYAQQQRDYRARLDRYNRQMRGYGASAASPYARRADALRGQADACDAGDRARCYAPTPR